MSENKLDNDKRGFLGVWIPKEIWQAEDISIVEKVIWAEINSFTRADKDCFISNEHISNFVGLSERQVSMYVNNLIEKGYVERVGFDGRKRFLKSTMRIIVQGRVEENFYPDLKEYSIQSSGELLHTNTITNSKTNTKKETAPSEKINDIDITDADKSLAIDCNYYMDKWNLFAEKNKLPLIQSMSEKRKKFLKAKLKNKDFDFEKILDKIKQSDFLLGRSGNWKVSFDFIIERADSYLKILEGKYDNNKSYGTTNAVKGYSGKSVGFKYSGETAGN